MFCRTCFLFPETQEHVFKCEVIRNKVPELKLNEVNYQMIYGKLEEQEKFTKLYHLMLKARTDIINDV